MKFLRDLLDRQARHFEKGGRFERLYPLWEAQDTFLFTPGEVTRSNPHVRDALDMKRLMITVVAALAGCVYMAVCNTGYQAHLAIAGGARRSTSGRPTSCGGWALRSHPTIRGPAWCTARSTSDRCWR